MNNLFLTALIATVTGNLVLHGLTWLALGIFAVFIWYLLKKYVDIELRANALLAQFRKEHDEYRAARNLT